VGHRSSLDVILSPHRDKTGTLTAASCASSPAPARHFARKARQARAVDALRPALIPAGPLSLGDPFRLLLATHIGLERCEDGENAEEGAASPPRSVQSAPGEVPLSSSQFRSDPRLTFATSSRSS